LLNNVFGRFLRK